MIFVLSVMRVVGGVCSFMGSVFCRVNFVCLCLLCTQLLLLSAVFCVICSLCLMVVVTIWWKRNQVWVLLWICMLRGSFPFVSTML